MGRSTVVLLPSLRKRLTALGENIRLARLRRKFSMELVAERAGISRSTLYAIEQGDPAVAVGSYASVLQCLGLENGLETLARDDELGRKLQDAALTTPKRAPRKRVIVRIKSERKDEKNP